MGEGKKHQHGISDKNEAARIGEFLFYIHLSFVYKLVTRAERQQRMERIYQSVY